MPQSYFIWKGIDCRTKHVIMQQPAPLIMPEERVQHKEVPGVNGDVTQREQQYEIGSYNSYIQTAHIAVDGRVNVKELYKWLRGNGYVTFSTDPERRQKAQIIGALTLNKHSHNQDWYEGEVQFYCQPFKERLAEVEQTINSSDSTKVVRNDGDIWAKPLIKLTTTATTVWIRFTKNTSYRTVTVDMTGLSNQDIYIDCETMEVYDAPRTGFMTWRATVGSNNRLWPLLYYGDTTVTGEGWSKAVITKRERFL